MRQGSNKKAFTLIELLVVVSIVSLLVSMLVPSLRSARSQAKLVVCSANLRQIGVGIWNYWTADNGRIPYIESPMTNGGAMTADGIAKGFGDEVTPSDELNPFDRELWPMSLPNVLMPIHMGANEHIFVCPAAVNGWPREGPFRYTYRPAAANQTNGVVMPEESYFRENFGFMDGRMLKTFRVELIGDPIKDSQSKARGRSTYLRDFISRDPNFHGPHKKGINVLDRRLAVEYRSHTAAVTDLSSIGGVGF